MEREANVEVGEAVDEVLKGVLWMLRRSTHPKRCRFECEQRSVANGEGYIEDPSGQVERRKQRERTAKEGLVARAKSSVLGLEFEKFLVAQLLILEEVLVLLFELGHS